MKDLDAVLAAFDGKHTAPLETFAERQAPTAAVIRALTAAAGAPDQKHQSAATWLLKRYGEDGLAFTPRQTAALLALLPRVTHWEAKLHLLQIFPGLTVPEGEAPALFTLLTGPGYRGDANKLVRAWTYNALAELAAQHPARRAEVQALLARGAEDEAASVRARLRGIAKAHGWARRGV
ncbi:hypothetical protein [Pelagibius sp.]|uniref:hypothetical protein n=1 Tax=Pelagibius sp. TaxID=1931238 RepID=UPI003B512A87